MIKKLFLISMFFIKKVSSFSDGNLNQVDTDFVLSKLKSKEWIVLDARLSDAYNGWKMDGLKKGGHIKGAKDFSYTWTSEKETLIKSNMNERGISKEKNIILYDSNQKDYMEVAKYLKNKGFKKIYYYNLNNKVIESLEMNSYPNYQLLVPAWWVKDLIDGNSPETYSGGRFKIFETSWGNLKDSAFYIANHIPTSVHINTDEVESAPEWTLNSDEELIEFSKNNGIHRDVTIVLYGDNVMASYRIAAILKYIGIKDVRVLNGGFKAWKRERYPTEKGINKKVHLTDIGIETVVNNSMVLTVEEALENVENNNNFQLVDIRSWNEHNGLESGYTYFHKKGRPKGAIWGRAGTSSVTLEDYRNPDDTMKNGYLIVEMWKNLNLDLDADKEVAFFCGSGWRAAEVLIYSQVMGFENTSLYSDGWMGWSANPENPFEVGE
ncbi:thiosulfate sulfurtransferase [Propionigenium maris DSM 9537]|uniref:Thiosulfate sulfurtransferase n=1 Tax=Propionigenium maris DSM 9537 TaxID=1123000 RepID=A0A9W6GIZ5_9FUSO|nr:rhodanese-like domain-containing protein [Propionigenium maris]GLI55048.1 thiosulfate sulfurtransferase [Propionigenium maris DSM 9537]